MRKKTYFQDFGLSECTNCQVLKILASCYHWK